MCWLQQRRLLTLLIVLRLVDILTQPGAVSSARGASISINCRTSQDVIVGTTDGDRGKKYLHWYQQKDGEAPKLLIKFVNERASGISDRFTGSGSGTDFTLTIRGVEAEDSGVYYCQQGYDTPFTQ
uniref:Ig-like domain-containing protein n=1 Tax=Sander lucioperca TaxID=283035 RepID=A0A8D0ARC4_SANLU